MSERILVVMPNWFGEALFATPFLRALRRASPNASIAALGVPRCQEVLAHNSHLHEFITYDELGIHRTLGRKVQLIARLTAMRFDTAFILRRSLTRTMMLAFAKIPRRIGFANLKSGWLLTHRVDAPKGSIHKAHGYLRLLEPLGLTASRESYEYYPSEAERAGALVFLREQGLTDLPAAPNPESPGRAAQAGGRPIVVLHPGANWAHKRWMPERFAELANRLSQQPLSFVITGGPDDQPLVQAMLEQMASRPIVLAGTTSLRQLAAVLEHASLLVSNDTGILHIACALGRPVVALYGPTSPAITGPLGDPKQTIVIHHPDCCPKIPCSKPDHPLHPGMASISVEEVVAAATHLLNAPSQVLSD